MEIQNTEIKNEELKKLYQTITKCMKCEALCSTRKNVVFGRGDEKPDIVFVGEAPGADEDKLGFTYAVLDRYIRTGQIDDLETKERIDHLNRINKHKLELMPSFQPQR